MPETNIPDSESPLNDLKFEDAVTQLTNLVNKMESEDVGLDSMVESYQEGLSLLKFCQKKSKTPNIILKKNLYKFLIRAITYCFHNGFPIIIENQKTTGLKKVLR